MRPSTSCDPTAMQADALPAMQAPAAPRLLENAHALTIGISRYQHAARLPQVQDAQDVHEVLHDPAIGAYAGPGVQPLLEEAATKQGIVAALEALARRTDADSTVFAYFSGHGGRAVVRGEDTCFLIPVDGDPSSAARLERTSLSGRELSALLRAIPARQLTVVLDCCRAADLAEPRDPVLDPELTPASLEPLARGRGRGRAVLAASRADGNAYVVRGQRNGVFTGLLLEGLRGGAVGVGGVIRICDLFSFVQQRVAALPYPQRPVFKAELEESYVVARYLGGAAPPLRLPAATGAYAYDAFVSYHRRDPAERAWVERELVPRLEGLGLRLCLESRDFVPGRARLREMERAVLTSRYTLAVLTPEYLRDPFEDFKLLLAQYDAVESQLPRFIPLLRRDCRPGLGVRMLQLVDAQGSPEDVDATLQRLALLLREPPRRSFSAP